jgi:hypothetical protein
MGPNVQCKVSAARDVELDQDASSSSATSWAADTFLQMHIHVRLHACLEAEDMFHVNHGGIAALCVSLSGADLDCSNQG